MGVHRSFMYHLLKEKNERQKNIFSEIIAKEIYPVAFNPLGWKTPAWRIFENKCRYEMVR